MKPTKAANSAECRTASSGPFSDCLRNTSLGYDTEPCNNNMGSAYANGFPFIAESLRVGVLGNSASKGNIFLAWRGESWLDECLDFGPSKGHSQRPKAFATRGQRSCCLKASVSGGGGACGLCLDFNCTLASLQPRKTTGYLSQCSQHVLGIAFCRFYCLFTCNVFWSAISTHFQLSYFGQPPVGRNVLPNLGFPAPINFESLTVGGSSDVPFEI